jgi:peptidoglycan/LPS O-acetylase OafA/YrhL
MAVHSFMAPSAEALPRSRAGYLPTLDGWRAIAIAGVLADHATTIFISRGGWYSHLRTGANGVSLFFAISGFLICSRLVEEEQLSGHISLRGFYIRRACRILPAALTYLGILAILALLGWVTVTPLEWSSCIFFFRNYLPPEWIRAGWGGSTIHFWSLAVEEHFYLIWPALLVLSGRVRARTAAAILAVAVAVWRWWDFHHQIVNRYLPGLLFPSRTDVRLDALLIGCLAALILAEPRWREWLVRRFTPAVWFACALAYVAYQVATRRHDYGLHESVLLAALVAGTVLRPETWVGKALENAAVRWVGRLSYSLYLWQQIFLVPAGHGPLFLLQRFPWNFIPLLLVAVLSYELIERPMVRLGHRLAAPPTPGRPEMHSPDTLPALQAEPIAQAS